ncbi:hypothetical protein V7055_09975 [Bacillus thuringiensis]
MLQVQKNDGCILSGFGQTDPVNKSVLFNGSVAKFEKYRLVAK